MAESNGHPSLPTGWRLVRLNELVREAQPGFACGERDPKGVVQLRMHNVNTRGELVWDELIRVPCSNELLERYELVDGDIVFNNTNSTELVGKTAVFRKRDEPTVYSNHFTRIRVNPGRLEPRYLANWLNLEWQHGVFEKLCNRWVGQSAIKNDKLLSLQIPLAPLVEQRRITETLEVQLTAIASARAATEAQLEAVNSLQSSYSESIFTDGKAKGWQLRRLGDFVESFRNGFGRRPQGVEQGPIVLRLADVSSGYIDLSSPRRVAMAESEIEEYRLSIGDVLFVRVNGSSDLVGRCVMVSSVPETLIFNDHLIRVRLHKEMLAQYLHIVSQLSGVRGQIVEAASTSAGQLTVNQEAIGALEVPAPDLEAQRDIVEKVEKHRELTKTIIAALTEQLASINDLPRAVLQEAFSGKL